MSNPWDGADEGEESARDLLHGVAVPSPGVDVAAVIAAGRRRRRRRRLAEACGGLAMCSALMAVIAVPAVIRDQTGIRDQPGIRDRSSATESSAGTPGATVVASPSPVAITCAGHALPVPPGAKDVTLTAMDPSGRYVAGWSTSGARSLPILWTDGVPARLNVGAPSAEIGDINRSGVLAGVASSADFTTEWVFRYANGHATKLEGLPGRWHYFPRAYLNDAGYVLVNAEPQGNSGGEDSVTLLWRPGSTKPERLPLPALRTSSAGVFGITDDNTIAGGTYDNGSGRDAYVWDLRGHGRRLEAPLNGRAIVYAVRGTWATGGIWPPAGGQGSLGIWDLTTGELTQMSAGYGGGVNALGAVVNGSGTVYRRDGTATLPPLAKGQSVAGSFIADTGLVAGAVSTAHTSLPVLWTC